eukprot:NODE_510_length_2387_cov_107.069788_g484_i0.p1 GENE.NODE_510_length_2387_cov_107.069788_g484_i0~~NODE_510_length_2387_cov_107.069788_g484_i0.p1  ORF type:complete len:757 (+),score=198.09 NODE_510_length_2387_cov_107.069788_g484_i0:60-2330(+)
MPAKAKAEVVFACPVQLFRYENGGQQFVDNAGCCLLMSGDGFHLQCYSPARETYCSAFITPEFQFPPACGADSYGSFWDSSSVSWSMRFKSADVCMTLLANICQAQFILKRASAANYVASVCPRTDGSLNVAPNHEVLVTYYTFTANLQARPFQLGEPQAHTSVTFDAKRAPDVLQKIVPGEWSGQYKYAIVAGGSQMAQVVLAELHSSKPKEQLAPTVEAAAPPTLTAPEPSPESTPSPARTPTNAPEPAPIVTESLPQPVAASVSTPGSSFSTSSPQMGMGGFGGLGAGVTANTDNVVQALLMAQLQQQPMHFAAITSKLDQINEKFDKFDLNAQFGAFQKIITQFDAHNKAFYEAQGKDERESQENLTKLNRERGEHAVTRQELQIAQRDLRVQTELRIQYSGKATKWKQKFRELEQRIAEEKTELTSSVDERVEDLQRQLSLERQKRLEAEEEHKIAMAELEEDAIKKGRLQAMANADTVLKGTEGGSLDVVVGLKEQIAKLEDDLRMMSKDHLEEVCGLQDKLVQEKENVKAAQKSERQARAECDNLRSLIQELEQAAEENKHEAERSMNTLKERLVNVGEGQLMMQFEKLKTEMTIKDKELEYVKEQLREKNMQVEAEMASLTKQRDRLQDEVRELRTFQGDHDGELSKAQIQLVSQKEHSIRLTDQLSKLQVEHQALLIERNELQGQVDDAGGTVLGRVKEIMSSVYYDLSDQMDEEKSYPGGEVLKLLLDTIKEQTLRSAEPAEEEEG